MRHRWMMVVLSLLMLVLGACNLEGTSNNDEQPINTPISTPTTKPQVTINTPQSGEEFVVEEPINVSVTISNATGVDSLQLLANNQPVRTIGIEPGDRAEVDSFISYTPRTAGDVTLTVIAARGAIQSDPVNVAVVIRSTQSQVTATPLPNPDFPQVDISNPNCRALINTNLNFRKGPDVSYDVIRVLGAGEVLTATGRLSDNSWWQLLDGSTSGWVSGSYVTMYDGTITLCRTIAVIAAPPSPTSSAPTATLTLTPTLTLAPTQTVRPTDQPTSTALLPANLTILEVFKPDDPIVIPAGESAVTVEFSLNITNTGQPISQQFDVTARVTNGDTFDVGTFGNLDPGQIISPVVSVTIDQTGEVTLIFTVDSGNDIAESDENDNTFPLIVTVTAGS